MKKEALIVGANGQDGSYLAEFLLEKGYKVTGLVRRSSSPNTSRIDYIKDKIEIVEGDVTDFSFMLGLINGFDEIYNLAAQSHVGNSFSNPIYTSNVNYLGCLNILEILRRSSYPKTRFYQASTSEMYGNNYTNGLWDVTNKKVYKSTNNCIDIGCQTYNLQMNYIYQDENTPFAPNSPYAIAKLAAHQMVGLYRKAYGLHASCGILFNHETPRRGEQFVTRKITKYLGKLIRAANFDSTYLNDGIPIWIKLDKLKLGNLKSSRDWGFGGDYIEAMWKMLQQDIPRDYVIGTGETHTVEEFLNEAFSIYNLKWEKFVEIDKSLMRPAEVQYLRANPALAKEKLGWEPKTSFKELVKIMVESDAKIH